MATLKCQLQNCFAEVEQHMLIFCLLFLFKTSCILTESVNMYLLLFLLLYYIMVFS